MNTASLVVVGNPGSRRVTLLQAARARLGQAPAREVAYLDLLAGSVRLAEVVEAGATVRIESPGKDFAVECGLLTAGAVAAAAEDRLVLEPEQIAGLRFERGRMWPLRQWYLGWCATLEEIKRQLAECPVHGLHNDPDEIALMFDKVRCQALLETRGVIVPPSLGQIDSFEALVTAMEAQRCGRVFVKLAHGSSAVGVVAYARTKQRQRAVTTVEVVEAQGEVRLYSSRRLQVYEDERTIRQVIDRLCRERVQVERWLPKAGLNERAVDLRVVVINGIAQHTVLRMSRGPFTNLHLLNERGDVAMLHERMRAQAWAEARRTCERAMAALPRSLYGGVDLLIGPDFGRHAVLEVNAFGDLLPNVLYDGHDTYAAELLAAQEREQTRC